MAKPWCMTTTKVMGALRGGKKAMNGKKHVEQCDSMGVRVEKGKGSRSGKHRCAVGGLDEEITALSPETKEKVEKVKKDAWPKDEKEWMVSYILDPNHWLDFKVNQSHIFCEVCAHSGHGM